MSERFLSRYGGQGARWRVAVTDEDYLGVAQAITLARGVKIEQGRLQPGFGEPLRATAAEVEVVDDGYRVADTVPLRFDESAWGLEVERLDESGAPAYRWPFRLRRGDRQFDPASAVYATRRPRLTLGAYDRSARIEGPMPNSTAGLSVVSVLCDLLREAIELPVFVRWDVWPVGAVDYTGTRSADVFAFADPLALAFSPDGGGFTDQASEARLDFGDKRDVVARILENFGLIAYLDPTPGDLGGLAVGAAATDAPTPPEGPRWVVCPEAFVGQPMAGWVYTRGRSIILGYAGPIYLYRAILPASTLDLTPSGPLGAAALGDEGADAGRLVAAAGIVTVQGGAEQYELVTDGDLRAWQPVVQDGQVVTEARYTYWETYGPAGPSGKLPAGSALSQVLASVQATPGVRVRMTVRSKASSGGSGYTARAVFRLLLQPADGGPSQVLLSVDDTQDVGDGPTTRTFSAVTEADLPGDGTLIAGLYGFNYVGSTNFVDEALYSGVSVTFEDSAGDRIVSVESRLDNEFGEAVSITGLPALAMRTALAGTNGVPDLVPIDLWRSERFRTTNPDLPEGPFGPITLPQVFAQLAAYTLAEYADRRGRDLRTFRFRTTEVVTPGTLVRVPGRPGEDGVPTSHACVPIGVRVDPERAYGTTVVARELISFEAEEQARGAEPEEEAPAQPDTGTEALILLSTSITGKQNGDPVQNGDWLDQSADPAMVALVTGTPTYVADGPGGKPAVRFQSDVLLATLAQQLGQPLTVFCVARTNVTPSGSQMLVGHDGTSFYAMHHTTNSGWHSFAGVLQPWGVASDYLSQFRLLELVIEDNAGGNNNDALLESGAVVFENGEVGPNDATTISLGGRGDGAAAMADAEYAAVVALADPSPAHRAAWRSFLASEYGFTLPTAP